MNVTRDIVKDLLTVYLSGEASRDTRTLVEEWLRTDAELARHMERARSLELPEAAPPDTEKAALDRTRRLLRWRMVLLGAAVYVTTLPLTITFGSDGYRGLLIDAWPERLVVFGLAVALWLAFWRLSRRLRVAGL
jgi:anti-sigma factor RsiW